MASAISKSKRQRLSNIFDQQTMFSSPTAPALDPFAASSPVTLGFPTTPPVVATPAAAGLRTSARRSAAKSAAAAKQTQTPVANVSAKKQFIVERQAPPKRLVFEETWSKLGPKAAGKGNPSPPPAKVLDSDGEEVVEEEGQEISKQRRGGKQSKSKAADIYEVPDDSEDELKLNGAAVGRRQPAKERQQQPSEKQPEKNKGGRQTKKKKEAVAADSKEPPTPKKRGRPKKADKIAVDAATENGADDAATAPAKVSRRQPKSKKKKAQISDSEEEPNTIVDNQLLPDLDYEHGKNSRQQELKGILSPRKKRQDERKTVAFSRSAGEVDEHEEEAGEGKLTEEVTFEDLPTKKKRTARENEDEAEPESAAVDEEDDDEEVDSEADGSDGDDEVCVICSNPDTRKGNQIVFCDGCDKAVHQKCYGIPRLPRGDWYCKECLELGKDKEKPALAAAPARRKDEGTMAAVEVALPEEKAPDIPNFERHLRSLQRVLVERCTGRRRTKLRGQEEAYAKTCQLVEQTIVAGEGNSMMVIGARGSGKTTVSSVPPFQLSKISTEPQSNSKLRL